LADAGGYGTVVAVYDSRAPIHVGRVATSLRPLDSRDGAAFLNARYSQLIARYLPHLYRVWDTNESRTWKGTPPREGAFMLGKLGATQRGLWASPLRPTHLVDYRHFTAIKNEWNRADFVLDASLAPGACVFVGRAALQAEVVGRAMRQFGGGAIQVFVPRDQFGYLRLNTWWALR